MIVYVYVNYIYTCIHTVKSDTTEQNLFMAPCSTGSVPWQLRCNGHRWNKPRKWKTMGPEASNGVPLCTQNRTTSHRHCLMFIH